MISTGGKAAGRDSTMPRDLSARARLSDCLFSARFLKIILSRRQVRGRRGQKRGEQWRGDREGR